MKIQIEKADRMLWSFKHLVVYGLYVSLCENCIHYLIIMDRKVMWFYGESQQNIKVNQNLLLLNKIERSMDVFLIIQDENILWVILNWDKWSR